MELKIIIDKGAYIPERAHDADAGFDIKTPKACRVARKGSTIIDSGVHVDIPRGHVGMLKSKSGLNTKHGIVSEGVIDSGYTGSIKVKLYNHGEESYNFNKGDKITQLVIMPIANISNIALVDKFNDSERGNNGFGSTGK